MPEIALTDSFAESKRLLKSKDHQPFSMAEQYRIIGKRLGVDFSPTIRLLETLPVFLHGSRHADVRRSMAINLSAAREPQECAAQQIVDGLPELLAPGRSVDLIEDFIRPLRNAMFVHNGTSFTIDQDLSDKATKLFDDRSRLKERMETNERLREFIESEPNTADQRLIVLGQNVLGATPLIGSMGLSLHAVFSANLGKSLKNTSYPKRYPVSAVPSTDRILTLDSGHADADSHQATRCVLHSKGYSREENDEMFFGMGEHACLGRPIANAVWSMVTTKLASLDVTILSSNLTMETDMPETREDYLAMTVLFIRPRSLKVEIGP